MPTKISPVGTARVRGDSRSFTVKSVGIEELGELRSPVTLLDDFRVSGNPFGPHPHAGFSQLTYVFEDSEGGVRSRDSFGHDIQEGPGGVVWTQAGSGLLHHEMPSDPKRVLHGLQVFVDLSAKNRHVTPSVMHLSRGEIPVWRSMADDRVRVISGSFAGVHSPLKPIEPLTFLDAQVRRGLVFNLPADHVAIVYSLGGRMSITAGRHKERLDSDQAVALHGGAGAVVFEALESAHVVILSGAEIKEPRVAQGPFVMNTSEQIADAARRFRAGEMGRLQPL